MLTISRKTEVIEGVAPDAIPFDALMKEDRPAILKGIARDWPLVREGQRSASAAMAYIASFCGGKKVLSFVSEPAMNGRFGYNEDVTGFNFTSEHALVGEFFERIQAQLEQADAPCHYIGSTDLDIYLPGLRGENGLVLNHAMFTDNRVLVSIWMGNRTVALAHYDMSNNLACCMVGRRRFFLFPPEQAENLYPGPLEPTPGGQVVTMTDIHNPDFDRFPRLKHALEAGEVAELEPGDVLFYPAMWWHQVEALDPFNAMINYWWNTSPAYFDTPQNTLLHALLSLRDRPESEKRAWRGLFDYYVFGPSERAGAHLPEQARGNLGPMDETKARRLRAYLLDRLNR